MTGTPHPTVRFPLVVLGLLLVGQSLPAQTSVPTSDIFFLDLGIVIEPKTGKEVYNRLVNPTSEEVKLRVKKVESGSVYMATSQEMLNTLQRIQQRMDQLEKSFQVQMNDLRAENRELRGMLAEMKAEPKVVTPRKQPPIVLPEPQSQPPLAQAPEPTDESPQPAPVQANQPQPKKIKPSPPPAAKPKLNYSEYMAAIFAYQRENYQEALRHFERLDLTGAPPEMAANVLYWSADAHKQLGEPYQALALLDKLLSEYLQSDRVDDALIQKGLLYRKTGQEELALAAFTRVVREFPSSEYTRLASMELKKAEIVP
ncbi:MAG: outer membrane protein assembly factor BamD [Candidatus Neomarinimicrobiota bacterium]|nr:MAG: outer membrane protein assembly factor BamD [Candidatus Neomarinimicrobiota bacterium]